MQIKQFQSKYFDGTREICRQTSTSLREWPEILWPLFHDYYPQHCPQWCFVAVDDDDHAIGYALCAPDFAHFEKTMRAKYIPQIADVSPAHVALFETKFAEYKKYLGEYPAHLHVDILPEAQGHGLGGKLICALLDKLRHEKIPGVFLEAGAHKVNAIKFFTKHGFTEIDRVGKDIIFGQKL